MATLDGIVYNGTEYELGGGAKLPYNKTEIALTTYDGKMTTNLTVFGTQKKYASLSVSSGQKYLVTGWCSSASVPCAFTVDANNTVTKLLGTVNEVYENAEITIPEGAVTLYINSKEDNTISAILLGEQYTQQGFTEKIWEIDDLANIDSTKANLPYNLTPIDITIVDGWINTRLEVNGATTKLHTSIPVSAGEKYAVTGGTRGASSTYSPCAFCVDENNKVTVLCELGYAFNEIIEIPYGAVTLYVNSSTEVEKMIGIASVTTMTQAQFSKKIEKVESKKPPLKVIFDGNQIRIKKKYNAEKDMILTMGNVGNNSLWSFKSLGYVANTDDEPNDFFVNFTGITTWNMSGSDWLGPFIVGAVNNGDGDTPTVQEPTGGNHGASGSGAITARQTSLSVLLNGLTEPMEGVIYSCENVVMKWTNLIQGYNTTKADGSGRGVMTETWTAVVDSEKVSLRNKVTALEAVEISRYYGFQMTVPSNPHYSFIGGKYRGDYTRLTTAGSGELAASGNNTCRTLVFHNDNYNAEIYVAPVDLGLFTLNDGNSFIPSNGKLYAVLIFNHTLALAEGDSCYLEGHYKFY